MCDVLLHLPILLRGPHLRSGMGRNPGRETGGPRRVLPLPLPIAIIRGTVVGAVPLHAASAGEVDEEDEEGEEEHVE